MNSQTIKMLAKAQAILCLLMVFTPITVKASSLDARIQAKAVLLVDAKSGEVLYQRNAGVPYPPASTTKLMTALLVWEKTGLKGSVKVAVEDTRVEPSHIPLRTGEIVSIRDLSWALLIGSDNDSAMTLSRAVGGSTDNFVRMMNERAKSLGCTDTIFKNPHGLPAKGQVVSARDLLKIFQRVLAVPELEGICSTKSFRLVTQIGPQNVRNHNKLLGTYAGMGPAKTGWTYASRHTYAASATRNGRELHLIILNSPDKWNDARALFDYGFSMPPSKVPAAPEVILAGSQSDNPSPTMKTHVIRRGETLYSIGKDYGIKVPVILQYNDIQDPDLVQPGRVLYIPAL